MLFSLLHILSLIVDRQSEKNESFTYVYWTVHHCHS